MTHRYRDYLFFFLFKMYPSLVTSESEMHNQVILLFIKDISDSPRLMICNTLCFIILYKNFKDS